MLHDISRLDTHLFWIVLFYYFMWIVLFYYFMWIVLFYYYMWIVLFYYLMWIVLFYYFMWIVLFYYFMWYTYFYTICFRLLPRLSWLRRDAIHWMVSRWRVLVRYNVNLKYKLQWWLQSYVAFVILFCAKRMSMPMSCKARCLFSKACTVCDLLQGYITLSLRNGGHLTENCSLNLNTMKWE